jgi:CRP-like cAMP-binding protein
LRSSWRASLRFARICCVTEQAISGVSLMASLPATERELLESTMEDVTVEAGDTLGRAGDFGWAMYTIVDGTVEVRSTDGTVIATLGPGDVFGEVALLRSGRRMADVVAGSRLRLKALFTRDFIRMRDDLPVFEAEVRRLIDARLGAAP